MVYLPTLFYFSDFRDKNNGVCVLGVVFVPIFEENGIFMLGVFFI